MVALFYISKFLSESSVILSCESRGSIVNYFLCLYSFTFLLHKGRDIKWS